MKYTFILLLVLICSKGNTQVSAYTTDNAHSHNDYEQKVPFWWAYDAGFGSIEADIFLMSSGLLQVAHDSSELNRNMTLENSYLKPLLLCMKKNKGYPFSDTSKKLQLLIDVKTDSVQTLNTLIALLQKYPSLIHCRALTWVITGNRPDQALFYTYPSFIRFDGELYKNYSKKALKKINLLSDDFERYSQWDGKSNLPKKDEYILTEAVKKAHQLNKPVRFWDAPDNSNAWNFLIRFKVDYINTDHIDALKNFLKNRAEHSSK